jgi:hypothetical protein
MASVLSRFDLAETLRCSSGLRRTMQDAPSMESAAREACRFLYDELQTIRRERACALIRCYKTHPYGDLPADLKAFAREQLPGTRDPRADMRCLTLLATVGDEPAWNDRRQSSGHQAIPMPTSAAVQRAPMVAELIRAFGIDIAHAIAPPSSIVKDLEGKSYGVFHVRDARQSPHIPAQDFVDKHRIRAVVGFGGSLKLGDLFAIILFSRVPIPVAAAERFRTIALHVKSSLFSYGGDQVFDQTLATESATR